MQKLQGSIDCCNEDGIVGWIIDTNNPHEPLEIEIIIDEEVIATTIADVFRPDLLDTGFKNGGHGFNVSIPDKFFDGKEHVAVIKEISTGLSLWKHTEKFTLFLQHDIIGVLDSCNEHGIIGWVVDKNYSNKPLQIEIIIDKEAIERTTVNIFRQGLLDAGYGDGKHGFHVFIPKRFFDNKEHTVIIKEISTEFSLWEYSKTFILAPQCAIVGSLDTCNEYGIKGWIADKNNLNASVDIEIIIDGEVVTTATAGMFRQDLLDAYIGNGNYAFKVPIPDKFWDGVEHKVTIQENLSKTILQGSPKTFKLANKFLKKEVDDLTNQNAKLKKENAVLLAQLHKIQEELERYYLQNQQFDAKVQKLTLEHGAQIKLIDELRSQILNLTQEREKQTELLKKIKAQFEQTIAILNIKQ
jgi:hypothetical protein